MANNKQVFAFRFDPDLMDRVDAYAQSQGWTEHHRGSRLRGGDHKGRDTGRTGLITSLLEALVEDRLIVQPRAGVNPFPADEKEAGSSSSNPIFISP